MRNLNTTQPSLQGVEPPPPKANEILRVVLDWANARNLVVAERYKGHLAREIKGALKQFPAEIVGKAALQILGDSQSPVALQRVCMKLRQQPALTWRELEEITLSLLERTHQEPFWWKKSASFHARRVLQEALRLRSAGSPMEEIRRYVSSNEFILAG